MRYILTFTAMLMAFSPQLQAEGLLQWLDGKATSHQNHKEAIHADGAELVTLEAKQNEMYPHVSPDGKYFLVASNQKQRAVISRRLLENGDPINIVSGYDQQVLDSMAWHGNDKVIFLSHRVDSLGLWVKPVEGGVTRRLHGRLDGDLSTPIVLEDGSIIAVHWHRSSRRMAPEKKQHSKKNKVIFSNWQMNGKQPHLIKINQEGVESELVSGVTPALSPDGKRVVFSMQAGRSWHLFMMDVDGTGLVQLTDERSVDVQPTWSPDGQWVAFTSNRGNADMRHSKKGNWDIWMIRHDGRDLMRLTNDKAMDGAPNFANNGRVYFHSNRKVSKEARAYHQVRGATKGFHIWSVVVPAL